MSKSFQLLRGLYCPFGMNIRVHNVFISCSDMNHTKLCATRRHLVGYIERGSVIFYQQKSDATVPPLSRGRPGHLSYFYGYRIQFITLMSHTVPQYSFHISYSFCYVTHLLSFAAVRSFLRSKPTVFALLHLLGSHVASDTLQTKATRSDIFDLISLSASYTRIWRCVHQHYNDCDIDEEDNCRLVIFSGALIDECEKEKHSILLFLHIQPLGLLSRCIFV